MNSINSRVFRGLLSLSLVAASAILVCPPPVLAQQAEVKYLRVWQAGNAEALREISGLTLAPDGTAYFTDRKLGVLSRLAGDILTAIPLVGEGRPFAGKKIGGIARLGDERFAVVNTSNDTVAIIDAKGNAERVFGGGSDFFGGGSGNGELKNPLGIAFSANRRLYVADGGNNRVVVYSEDGVFIRSIGAAIPTAPTTALNRPVQVSVDDAERVYVLDESGNGRLSVYDHQGVLLKQIKPEDLPGTKGARWRALATTSTGRAILADTENGQVIELDWEKSSISRRFGSSGSGRGQFANIAALAISGSDLLVADSGNWKIETYRLPDNKVVLPVSEKLVSVRRHRSFPSACDRAYTLDTGDMLCLDGKSQKVTWLDPSGKPKANFDEPPSRPVHAAIDARDIAIAGSEGIKVYSHDRKLRFAFGRSGSRDGEFDDIGGLHLANYIYVADTGNRRVQMFTRDGIFVNKLEDGDRKPRRIARPTAVVTNAAQTLYVADAETSSIQVYSPALEWTSTLSRKGDPYSGIHGLGIDGEDRIYVFASTEKARQAVDVFQGNEHVFSFSAYRAPKIEPSKTAIMSVQKSGDDILLFDLAAREGSVYQLLQSPQEVGGVEVRGDPSKVRVSWRKSPERYVSAYRVYGAPGRDGPFERLLETKSTEAEFASEVAGRYLAYRVSAITRLAMEGDPSIVIDDRFRIGFRHFEGGRFDAAVTALTRAAQNAPDHASPVEYLGRSFLALGKHDAAIAQFQDLASRSGHETTGLRLQAQAIAATGDLLGARSVLERAIAAHHADVATYQLCGEVSLRLADPAGAVNCLEIALKREAKNGRLRALLGDAFVRLGAVDKGIGELEAAQASHPSDPEIWRLAGQVMERLGRHREALSRYERVLSLQPRDADALLASANTHLQLADFDKARSIALSLVGSPAQESRGQYLIGRIAALRNSPEESMVAFNRATRLDPMNSAAWVGLAETNLALKDENKAREALGKAAQLEGADINVFRLLADLEARNGKHAAALAALERAVALAPGDYNLRLAHARTLASLDRWSDSGKAAREAQRLSPKSVEAMLLVAEGAYRQGKIGEAITTLKQALALEPDSYLVRYRLGRSYADNNFYGEAQTHLERAAQLEPSKDEPYLVLAKLELGRRAYDAAIAALTKVVNLNPSPANNRELDVAYELKKKSQTGVSSRVVIENLRLSRIFTATHMQYATKPLGKVKVRNESAEDYKGLRVSFFIKEYMDFPVTQEIAELKANQSIDVPLHATFSKKVLGIDEDTRVLAVVSLAMGDARDGTQEITQAMTLYGKNAIHWEEFDMVGSFVTPKDVPLSNFVREAVNRYGPPQRGVLNRALGQAAAVFNTLSANGLRYQADPNTPYSRVSADQVDYVQFPRETARLRSGDCDDLSVLLTAAYENLGIETALIDVPGHVFLMFRTGVKESERGQISLQDDLLVVVDGEIWIPVEATLIATSFTEAWAEGARRYRKEAAAKQLKVVPLRKAWEKFPPVGLSPAQSGIDVPAGERVTRLLEREQQLLIARRLESEVLSERKVLAANPGDIDAQLQIGIVYARNGIFDVALREFDAIIEKNPRHAAAHNNRGNIFFAQNNFERALDAYLFAEEIDPMDASIRINTAMTYYRLGKLSEAQTKFREATQSQKELAEQYRAFGKLLTH